MFPHTSIVAFEPDQRAAPKYRERFKKKSNDVLHDVALSDKAGKAQLMLGKETTFSSLEQHANVVEGISDVVDTVEVRAMPLDHVQVKTEGFDKVFVKLDVQGHEVQSVRGGAQFLENVDVVLAELSFAPEYKGHSPSFGPVANLLQHTRHYPIIFQDYGRSLSPYAWERDVIFVKEKHLERIWGW